MRDANGGTAVQWKDANGTADNPYRYSNIADAISAKESGSSLSSGRTNSTTWPAFYHALNNTITVSDGISKSTPASGTSGWFLPSIYQWNIILKALSGESNNLSETDNNNFKPAAVNGKIADDDARFGNYNYLSSSEIDTSRPWYWYAGGGRAAGGLNKTHTATVRAVFAFNTLTAAEYTVTYDANGGSGAPDAQTKDGGIDLTLSSTVPTRDGYTFNGWNTKADGSGTAYAAGATYSANADVTLYAQWPCNTATSGIDWDPSTKSGTFLMPAYDVEVNTELWYILKQDGTTPTGNKTKANVFLERTLNNSTWSTFCAPFNIGNSAAEAGHHFDGTSLEGATVKEFTGSSYDASTQTLTLDFTNATSIVAGTPYLVMAEVDRPRFEGVTQDWTTTHPVTATGGYATFVPVLEKKDFTGEDKTVLYLSGANTLYYPSTNMTIKGFRAYFQLNNGLTAGDLPNGNNARAFVLNIDGEQTGIRSLNPDPSRMGEGSIYSLDGRKVQNVTRKGIYIRNGRKVVIK